MIYFCKVIYLFFLIKISFTYSASFAYAAAASASASSSSPAPSVSGSASASHSSPDNLTIIYVDVDQGHCEVTQLINKDTILLVDCGTSQWKQDIGMENMKKVTSTSSSGSSSAAASSSTAIPILATDVQQKAKYNISQPFIIFKNKKVFITHLHDDHYSHVRFFLDPIIEQIKKNLPHESHSIEFFIGDLPRGGISTKKNKKNKPFGTRLHSSKELIKWIEELPNEPGRLEKRIFMFPDPVLFPQLVAPGTQILAGNACRDYVRCAPKGDTSNGNSLVIRVEDKHQCSAMFTGDATPATMAYMLGLLSNTHPQNFATTLLLISHHGSTFENTIRSSKLNEQDVLKQWIGTTEAKSLFVSPGGEKPYNHPKCETIDTYLSKLGTFLIHVPSSISCFYKENSKYTLRNPPTDNMLLSTLNQGSIRVETENGNFTLSAEKNFSLPNQQYNCRSGGIIPIAPKPTSDGSNIL